MSEKQHFPASHKGERGNVCPACGASSYFCIDSRSHAEYRRIRRLACKQCGHREKTYEITEAQLNALEDSGRLIRELRVALSRFQA